MTNELTLVQPRLFGRVDLRRIPLFWAGLAVIVFLASIPLLRTYDYSMPYMEQSPEAVYYLAALEARGLFDNRGYDNGRSPLYVVILSGMETALDRLGMRGMPNYLLGARLLSVGMTLLALVFIALTARAAAGDLAGLVAGAAWGSAPLVVYLGVDAMPDPLIYMASALTLWLATEALLNPKRAQWCIWSMVVAWIACLIKYTALPLIAPGALVALVILIRERRAGKPLRRRWVAVLALPVIGTLVSVFVGLVLLTARPTGYIGNLLQPARALNNIYYAIYPITPVIVGVVCALGALAWFAARRWGREQVKLGVVGLSLVVLIFVPWIPTSFDLANPSYRMRDVVPGTPAICILLGIAFVQVIYAFPKRWQTAAGLIALGALGVTMFVPFVGKVQEIMADRVRADHRVELRQWADVNLDVGTVLLPNGSGATFNPYWGGIPGLKWFDWQISADYMQRSVDEWRSHRGISYVVFPQSVLENYMKHTAGRAFLAPMLHLRDFYDPNARGPKLSVYRIYRMEHETAFIYGGAILMSGYDQSAEQGAPGDTVTFRFYWQATQLPASNYSLFVHLTPPDADTIIAQVDNSPAVLDRPTLTWDDPNETLIGQPFALTIPADLAPGTYTVRIGLYDYLTGVRLPITDSNGSSQGDSLALVQLEVGSSG